jgi:hypothetical protein
VRSSGSGGNGLSRRTHYVISSVENLTTSFSSALPPFQSFNQRPWSAVSRLEGKILLLTCSRDQEGSDQTRNVHSNCSGLVYAQRKILPRSLYYFSYLSPFHAWCLESIYCTDNFLRLAHFQAPLHGLPRYSQNMPKVLQINEAPTSHYNSPRRKCNVVAEQTRNYSIV